MEQEINIKINYVMFIDNEMVIGWSADIGFGQLRVMESSSEDNKYLFDTECLGIEFAKEVLNAAVCYLIEKGEAIE